jgi:hypothetical protein
MAKSTSDAAARAGAPSIKRRVKKPPTPSRRLPRRVAQMQMATGNLLTPLRSLYFGGRTAADGTVAEPFASLHASRVEFGNG